MKESNSVSQLYMAREWTCQLLSLFEMEFTVCEPDSNLLYAFEK